MINISFYNEWSNYYKIAGIVPIGNIFDPYPGLDILKKIDAEKAKADSLKDGPLTMPGPTHSNHVYSIGIGR